MRCDEIRERLPLHPDADEHPDVRETVDAHLRECPACEAVRRAHLATWDLLSAWPDVDPAPSFPFRVRERVDRAARRARRRLVWIPLTAAAALLVAVTALVFRPSGPTAPGLTAAEIEIVRHLDLLEKG
jgi:predicted anti-sigma-YlaC factor YlaD